MEFIQNYLFTPFARGIFLGLLVTFFTWKSGFAAKRNLKKEIKRVELESKELQQHLNTQLKVNAEGNESLQKKLDELREQNENLRINLSTPNSPRNKTGVIPSGLPSGRPIDTASASPSGPVWPSMRARSMIQTEPCAFPMTTASGHPSGPPIKSTNAFSSIWDTPTSSPMTSTSLRRPLEEIRTPFLETLADESTSLASGLAAAFKVRIYRGTVS